MRPPLPPHHLLPAIFLAVAALPALGADKKAAPAAKPALTVTTVRATSGEFPLRLEANGNVAAWQETIVGAETAGQRITDVRVNIGDAVKKGDVLATFAVESLNAEVAQQNAAIAEAEAGAIEARGKLARGERLVAPGAISAQEIDALKAAAGAAEARLNAAKAMAEAVRVRFRQARVVAPDNGVISARAATVGAVAQPGQELFRLIRDSRLEWRAEVTAADLARVKPGQRVAMTLPGGGSATGKVRMLAPTIDPQTRNALVYVDLVGRSEARAGMFARGEFDLGRSSAITVPQQAVVVRDGFYYVFTVANDNRVAQRKVKVGRRDGDRVEVLEGLPAELPVVAQGAGFLNDGDLVAVAPSPQPSPKGEGAKSPSPSGALGVERGVGEGRGEGRK